MRIKLTILIIILFIGNAFSQEQDFETWTSFTIKKQVSSKIDLKLNQELRLFENSSQINVILTDLGGSYKLSKNFSLNMYYRFIRKSDYSNFINQHRFYGGIEYAKSIKNIEFGYRTRFQSKYSEIYSRDYGLVPANTLRNKISLSYKIKDKSITPKISAELFLPIENSDYNFSKIRTSIGIKYKINKYNSINLAFLIEKEIYTSNSLTANILALGYGFRL